MAARLMLQSAAMKGRGLGWKADPCVDPESCETHLCVADDHGSFWHPADPLAFAKWRVRADLDAIPLHVLVKAGPSWETVRRGAVWGAVGVGGTAAAVLGLWLGRQYAPKVSRPA